MSIENYFERLRLNFNHENRLQYMVDQADLTSKSSSQPRS